MTRDRDAVVLTRAHTPLALMFTDAAPAALPLAIENVDLVAAHGPAGTARSRFELHSGARRWHLEARSLQVHERVALYGNVIALPRFALRQRLLWVLLLWVARFRWGQAIIRKITGRTTPGDEPAE